MQDVVALCRKRGFVLDVSLVWAFVEMKGKAVSRQAGRSSFAVYDHRRTSSIIRRWCVVARSGSWGRAHGVRALLGGLCKTCIRPAGGLWRCGGCAGDLGRGVFGVN